MKAILAVVLLGISGGSLYAQVDYSGYDLTEAQLALLDRLEQRGFTDEQLINAAETFERSNQPQPETYIPPHTPEELDLVYQWAKGGAYLTFARDAGVEFDRDAFLADCPNVALFQFGKASGTEFLSRDVMLGYYNTAYMLNMLLVKSTKEEFQKKYMELISKTEFAKYIISPYTRPLLVTLVK